MNIKLKIFSVLLGKTVSLIWLGKILADRISNSYPHYADLIPKGAFALLVVPILIFFVPAPFFRSLEVDKEIEENNSETRGSW